MQMYNINKYKTENITIINIFYYGEIQGISR